MDVSRQGAEAARAGTTVITTFIQNQTKIRLGLYLVAALFVIVAGALLYSLPIGGYVVGYRLSKLPCFRQTHSAWVPRIGKLLES